jgi:aryl-alcohol dehydrogenase-like predicted oxidoreductase
MSMSAGYGPAGDPQEMTRVIGHAVERGVTFFDTAESHGPFANEALLGEALAPFREQVAIATKFGHEFGPSGGRLGLDSTPEHVQAAVEGSLRRLRVTSTTNTGSTRQCPSRTLPGR